MDITLEELQLSDAEKLFEFEVNNRHYFEQLVPSRGEDYYEFETFKRRHQALLEEQFKGHSYYHLIKNEKGFIVGRMNLVDINKSRKVGYLGYRIGEVYTGKGIAIKALKMFLQTIHKQGIKQVLAKTTTNNIASQKILEKNGFTHTLSSDEKFEMNGEKVSFVYYKWDM